MESLKPYPTTAEGYRIELAMKSRLKEILNFLRENYHGEETIARGMKSGDEFSEEELKLIEEDEDEMIVQIYERSPALIAIEEETDQIVGVLLTILGRRAEEDQAADGVADLFEATTYKSNFVNEYYGYLAKIDKEANVFVKYPNVDAIMEIFAVCVDKEHRNKGLAKDLSQVAVTLAKAIPGVGLVYGVYTSAYSRKVAEATGMTKIQDVDLGREFVVADEVDGVDEADDGTNPNIFPVMALEIDAE